MAITAPALEGVEQPKEVTDLVHERVAPVVRSARGAWGRHNQMVEEDTVALMGLGGLKGKVPAPEYTSGEVRLQSCWDTQQERARLILHVASEVTVVGFWDGWVVLSGVGSTFVLVLSVLCAQPIHVCDLCAPGCGNIV